MTILPVPRQEFVAAALRGSCDVGEHIGEPGLGIDIVKLGGADQGGYRRRAHAATRTPPRSEPTNSQERLPRAKGLSALSAALFVRQMRPSSRKRAMPGSHITDLQKP